VGRSSDKGEERQVGKGDRDRAWGSLLVRRWRKVQEGRGLVFKGSMTRWSTACSAKERRKLEGEDLKKKNEEVGKEERKEGGIPSSAAQPNRTPSHSYNGKHEKKGGEQQRKPQDKRLRLEMVPKLKRKIRGKKDKKESNGRARMQSGWACRYEKKRGCGRK